MWPSLGWAARVAAHQILSAAGAIVALLVLGLTLAAGSIYCLQLYLAWLVSP